MSKTIVGLDIGSSAIRGVQVTYNKGKVVVDKVGEIYIPHGTVVEGAITEEGGPTVTEAIKELWKRAKFNTDLVYLGMGGSSTLIRTGELDWAPRDDLLKILPYSSLVEEKILVADKSELVYDYHTLSEYTKREPDPSDPDEYILTRKKSVILCGVRRSAVDNAVDAVLNAKLKPVHVDVNAFATVRAYNRMHIPEKYATADISIDIGADTITVVFHKSGQPLFIRLTKPGGSIITGRIATMLGISFDKAEMRKFETFNAPQEAEERIVSNFNLDNDEDNIDPYAEEPVKTEEELRMIERVAKIRPVLNEGNSVILNNIRDSLQHFLSGDWGRDLPELSGIYLSGGVSYTPALVDRIQSEFNIPVVHAQPFDPYLGNKELEQIMGDLYGSEAKFVTALGISLAVLSEGDSNV